MDRREAIGNLEWLRLKAAEPIYSNITEALDLAIEALGQTECTDCISRQQAIEEMNEVPFILSYNCNMEQDELVDTIEKQIRGCSQRMLNSLPPVTPTEQTIKEIMDFIGSMNMTGEISNEAYAKISDFVDDGTPTERTGEWKHTMTCYPYCSECEWMPEEDEMTHGYYNYCPDCGASMRSKGGDAE